MTRLPTSSSKRQPDPPREPSQKPAAPPDANTRESGRRYRAPARLIGGQFQIETRLPIAILTLLSLGFCVAMFPPIGWWPLAYVCLTPWAVCVCTTEKARRVYFASYLFGLGFFLINVRWLAPVTLPGYLALSAIYAACFPLVAWPVRHMFRRHGASLAIALPIVWTAVEWFRSQSLAGFPWYLIAHTHYRVLSMIQISDLVGAYGVSFVIVMVNGWFTDLLIQPILIWRRDQPERTTRLPLGSMATLVVVSLTLLYGAMYEPPKSLAAPATMPATTSAPIDAAGPRVAVIQHDFPSFVDSSHSGRTPFTVIYESYMDLVRQAAAGKPDLIVLPETAWFAYFNDEFLTADARTIEQIRTRCFPPDWTSSQVEHLRNWSRETREALRKIGRESGAAIVTGSASIEWKPLEIPPRAERFNSAFLFSPQPDAPIQRFDKIHLVLFGEFVPFRYKFRPIYLWLNSITPWGANGLEYSMSFGAGYHPLEFSAPSLGGRRIRAATPICYEDTEPYIVRGFAEASNRSLSAEKGIDAVLNISNDGWFAHSSELEMHLAASVFRAVENRVPVARAVNTGASAIIDPDGRIQSRVQLGPDKLAQLPKVRDSLSKLREVVTSPSGATKPQRVAAALTMLRTSLAEVGREFLFMSDRLHHLIAEVPANLDRPAAPEQAALLDQLDEDLATVDRWRVRPWTAPAVGVGVLRLDPRETIYTRWGDWFATACAMLSAAMLLDWLLHRIRGRGDRPSAATRATVAAMCLLGLIGPVGCNDPRGFEPMPSQQQEIEKRALHFLLNETGDQTPLYRMHAIEALQETAPAEGKNRIRACARDEVPPVRFAAVFALGIIRDRESAELFRQAAEDNDRSVRIAGIFGLHRIGNPGRTSELASMLLNDPEPKVRANAALAIGMLGEPKSVKVLQRALNDKDELVRLQALDSMVLLNDPKATRDLLFYGHSGAGPKMVDALMTLGTARAKSAEELFTYRLKEGPYNEVRLAAARGLGRLGRDDGYTLAISMLEFIAPNTNAKDDPPQQQETRIRTLSASALEAIGNRSALGKLSATMDDDVQPMPVRIAAARAILGIRRGPISPPPRLGA